jgi:hypothetical protein
MPQGESYDKNIHQIVKALRYEIRQPIALVQCGKVPCLATAVADAEAWSVYYRLCVCNEGQVQSGEDLIRAPARLGATLCCGIAWHLSRPIRMCTPMR